MQFETRDNVQRQRRRGREQEVRFRACEKHLCARREKRRKRACAKRIYVGVRRGRKHHKAHVLKARNCNCARHGDELDIRVRQVEPSDARKQRKTGEDLDVQLRRGRQHNGKEGIRLHHGGAA